MATYTETERAALEGYVLDTCAICGAQVFAPGYVPVALCSQCAIAEDDVVILEGADADTALATADDGLTQVFVAQTNYHAPVAYVVGKDEATCEAIYWTWLDARLLAEAHEAVSLAPIPSEHIPFVRERRKETGLPVLRLARDVITVAGGVVEVLHGDAADAAVDAIHYGSGLVVCGVKPAYLAPIALVVGASEADCHAIYESWLYAELLKVQGLHIYMDVLADDKEMDTATFRDFVDHAWKRRSELGLPVLRRCATNAPVTVAGASVELLRDAAADTALLATDYRYPTICEIARDGRAPVGFIVAKSAQDCLDVFHAWPYGRTLQDVYVDAIAIRQDDDDASFFRTLERIRNRRASLALPVLRRTPENTEDAEPRKNAPVEHLGHYVTCPLGTRPRRAPITSVVFVGEDDGSIRVHVDRGSPDKSSYRFRIYYNVTPRTAVHFIGALVDAGFTAFPYGWGRVAYVPPQGMKGGDSSL